MSCPHTRKVLRGEAPLDESRPPDSLRLEQQLDRSPPGLEAHIRECAECARALRVLNDARRAVRSPAETLSVAAEARIWNSLSRPVPEPRRMPWAFAAGGALAFGLLVSVWVRSPALENSHAPMGQTMALAPGAALEVERAKLTARGDCLSEVERSARAPCVADGVILERLEALPHARWRLLRGHLEVEVEPLKNGETFAVETVAAIVEVVGTRFSVQADDRATEVHVEHGVVRVSPVSGGAARLLHAREHLRVSKDAQPASSVGAHVDDQSDAHGSAVRAEQARAAQNLGEDLQAVDLAPRASAVRTDRDDARLDGADLARRSRAARANDGDARLAEEDVVKARDHGGNAALAERSRAARGDHGGADRAAADRAAADRAAADRAAAESSARAEARLAEARAAAGSGAALPAALAALEATDSDATRLAPLRAEALTLVLDAGRAALGSAPERSAEAAESVRSRQPPPALEVEALLLAADAARHRGQSAMAAGLYGEVAAHSAGSSFAEESLLRRARLLAADAQTETALRALKEAAERFQTGDFGPERALLEATLQLDQNEPERAADTLDRVGAAHGAAEVRVRAAEALSAKDPGRARALAESVIRSGASSAVLGRAHAVLAHTSRP